MPPRRPMYTTGQQMSITRREWLQYLLLAQYSFVPEFGILKDRIRHIPAPKNLTACYNFGRSLKSGSKKHLPCLSIEQWVPEGQRGLDSQDSFSKASHLEFLIPAQSFCSRSFCTQSGGLCHCMPALKLQRHSCTEQSKTLRRLHPFITATEPIAK